MKSRGMGGRKGGGGAATRPKCVLNRLVCHALSSRDIKAVNSPRVRACAYSRESACMIEPVCARLCVCNERALNYHTDCSREREEGGTFCQQDEKTKKNKKCGVHVRVCAQAPIQADVCVVESKAFDPNLCLCIIYSPMPAPLLFVFQSLSEESKCGKKKKKEEVR